MDQEGGSIVPREQHLKYHMDRARTELDLAYSASHPFAAQAHMKLSALHMSKLKEMDERCGGSECGTRR